MRTESNNNTSLKFFIAFFIAVVTFSSVSVPYALGIDPPWMFANNFLHLDQRIGTVCFTSFGPLGFLLWTTPTADNILIASIFWLLIRFFLAFTSIELVFKLNKEASIGKLIFRSILIFLILIMIPAVFGYLAIFFSVISLLLLHCLEPTKNRYLLYAAFFALINLLICPTYSTLPFSALFTYLVIFSINEKSLKQFIRVVFFGVISYLALWLIINHSLISIVKFLIVNFNLIIGCQVAASLNPANNWLDIGVVFVAFSAVFLVFRNRNFFAVNGQLTPALFLLPFFIAFKYAYAREDTHLFFMFYFLATTFCYFLVIASSNKKILVLLIIGLAALFFSLKNQFAVGYKNNFLVLNTQGLTNIKTKIFQYPEYKDSLLRLSAKNLKQGKMPKIVLEKVGNSSVDIYPEDVSLIVANFLNWQPRPLAQSLLITTAYLDQLNATHFADSDKAPSFIIWAPLKLNSGLFRVDGDGRYLLSEAPATIYQILKWYKVELLIPPFAVLKRTKTPQVLSPKILKSEEIAWNAWVKVPEGYSGILRAHVFPEETWFEKIKIILYKQDSLWVDYKLIDGSVISHRFVTSTAAQGIWVSPAIATFPEIFTRKLNVLAIRFQHSTDDFFVDKIKITWEQINFRKTNPRSN
ncbi:MAG: hypothetical protein M1561_06060 [Gammaproteobacteria bacterium]|nr:hypothetical protein [Gammaproteobacteria bacterium]